MRPCVFLSTSAQHVQAINLCHLVKTFGKSQILTVCLRIVGTQPLGAVLASTDPNITGQLSMAPPLFSNLQCTCNLSCWDRCQVCPLPEGGGGGGSAPPVVPTHCCCLALKNPQIFALTSVQGPLLAVSTVNLLVPVTLAVVVWCCAQCIASQYFNMQSFLTACAQLRPQQECRVTSMFCTEAHETPVFDGSELMTKVFKPPGWTTSTAIQKIRLSSTLPHLFHASIG
jgi:hypothetical protein